MRVVGLFDDSTLLISRYQLILPVARTSEASSPSRRDAPLDEELVVAERGHKAHHESNG